MATVLLVAGACEEAHPELMPDAILQDQLGLTAGDRVHTIRVSADVGERADPMRISVRPGDYVQFVSADWLVHEVSFCLDSLAPPARDFLTRTQQAASPPLLELDARFVVSFEGAPAGRYPYRLVGNRAPGQGVVVVEPPPP